MKSYIYRNEHLKSFSDEHIKFNAFSGLNGIIETNISKYRCDNSIANLFLANLKKIYLYDNRYKDLFFPYINPKKGIFKKLVYESNEKQIFDTENLEANFGLRFIIY